MARQTHSQADADVRSFRIEIVTSDGGLLVLEGTTWISPEYFIRAGATYVDAGVSRGVRHMIFAFPVSTPTLKSYSALHRPLGKWALNEYLKKDPQKLSANCTLDPDEYSDIVKQYHV